jgi:hypothetical protein
MFAAWNESDPAKTRGHLERALVPDVVFIDPSVEVHGIDEFEANIRDVREKVPGASYEVTSAVDSHHNLHRYSWAIVLDGRVLLPGLDVTQTDDDGRVTRVLGFFGPLPSLP